MVYAAFPMAEKYRMPAYVLTDGVIGQMMESLELPEPVKYDYDPEWKMGRRVNGEANIISSIYMEYNDLEALNIRLQEKYALIQKTEQQVEEIAVDDADLALVAYGISSRVAQGAVEILRAEGLKVGLIRPKMVFPFPNDSLRKAAEHVKGFLCLEHSAGQMIEDVKLAIDCKLPVKLCNRMGGNLLTVADVCAAAKAMMKEVCK